MIFAMNITEDQKIAFDQYLDLLTEWNKKMNLTAITDPGEIREKHFHDCSLPITEGTIAGSVCDVGSGAGFPGIVWKILQPDLAVVLLEPTGKRCTFLNTVIQELNLKNITVVNARAEDYVKEKRESFDVVTARAVAQLSILTELCLPLTKPDGVFIAMKGSRGMEELEAAENALRLLQGKTENCCEEILPNGETRMNLWIRKTGKTPAKYPRPYGQIKKKPLGAML